VVLIAAALFVVIRNTSTREPSYDGKPLSWWCEQINSKGLPNKPDEEAMKAVRALGTNAIPWLLSELGKSANGFLMAGNQLLGYQQVVKWRLPGGSLFDDYNRRARASWGIFALGRHARSVIPDLEKMLQHDDTPAPWALVGIGHDAVAEISRALANGNQMVRINTVGYVANAAALGWLNHEDLKTLLPIMHQQATTADNYTRDWMSKAIKALEL
jgi:hypothetical protein